MDEQDPSARYRERRRQRRRRQVRIRRAVAVSVLLALAAGVTLGARAVSSGGKHAAASAKSGDTLALEPQGRKTPTEIRGVHVTMALASLPGRLNQYLAIPGLNTIELDVKDEQGRVGFVPSSVPLTRRTGAAGSFYKAKQVARLVHRHGDYLVGRVVTFEDPVLSEKRPDLAVHNADGSLWHTNAGLGWTNPYDRRVWRGNTPGPAGPPQGGLPQIPFGS